MCFGCWKDKCCRLLSKPASWPSVSVSPAFIWLSNSAVAAACAGHHCALRLRPKPPYGPRQALAAGTWVKWIGGASNHDLAALEDLAALAALAGADCLDVAADAAVVAAVRRGIAWAQQHGRHTSPWLMVSLSDGEDPHFRKAWFDPSRCPADCPRPCAKVCPPLAISAQGVSWPSVAMAAAAVCRFALWD